MFSAREKPNHLKPMQIQHFNGYWNEIVNSKIWMHWNGA